MFKEMFYLTQVTSTSNTLVLDKYMVNDFKVEYDSDGDLDPDTSELNKNNINFKKEIDINSIKTIYLSSHCGAPGVKVREWAEKNNIKLVRDASKADACFYSEKDYDCASRLYCQVLSKQLLIKLLTSSVNKHSNTIEIIRTIQNMHDVEYFFTNRTVFYNNPLLVNGKESKTWTCQYVYDQDAYESVSHLLIADNIYHVDVLNKFINNGVVINREMYNSLCLMFDSEDPSNHVVAMEIMANSDFEKSGLYLYRLFMHYVNNKIYNRKERNHVNFKNLVKWMNKGRYHEDDTAEFLIEKGLFTQSVADELLGIFKEDKDRYMTMNSLTFTDIDFSDEIKSKIILDPVVEEKLEQL